MSADFQTTLIKDSRLADITDELSYAVLSGPSSNTYQQFSAVSTSNSAISFNAQIPSENIVVSREVLLNTDIHFTITITDVPPTLFAFGYGETDALQAFPLNSLFTTCSAQINNTNVSCNLQDVLPSILRLNNNRELYRYNGMCPVLPDQSYKRFFDGIDTTNNPLGDYEDQSYDGDLLPRGAYPIQNLTLVRTPFGGGPPDASPQSQNLGDIFVITGFVNVTEPLLGLSPFIYGEPEYNKQGLVGINAMSFVFNIDSSCKRFWSTANPYTYNVSLGTQAQQNPFTNCRMLMNFLSTQPTDLISAKNVVPYMDLPRYLSLQSATGPLASGATAILNSQNIQINQLPDYFIISVRKPMAQQTVQDSSTFLKINSISVNLNNTSGLLSSATPQDLWRISVNNHSQQSWAEFSGQVSVAAAGGVGALIPTTGSLLILNPAYDLSLPDYLSCGSIGQYNFQFQVSVTNIDPNQLTPEICIICVNSGVFTTLSGSSNIFTGILTKQMVLDAKTSEEAVDPVTSVQYKRYVGGALLNRVASAVKHMPKQMRRKIGMGVGAQSMGAGVILGAGVHTGGRRGKSRLDELCR
jgi:hypothetical protein